jgi:hypothetical protein
MAKVKIERESYDYKEIVMNDMYSSTSTVVHAFAVDEAFPMGTILIEAIVGGNKIWRKAEDADLPTLPTADEGISVASPVLAIVKRDQGVAPAIGNYDIDGVLLHGEIDGTLLQLTAQSITNVDGLLHSFKKTGIYTNKM